MNSAPKKSLMKQIRQFVIKFNFVRWLRHNSFTVSTLRPIQNRKTLHRWWANDRPAPPPHVEKMNVLLYLANLIDAKYMVETGSYMGDTVRHLQDRFEKLYSLELAEVFANPLVKEFKNKPSVEIVIGDSAQTLPKLINSLDKETLFWLDAHFSGGDTEGESFVPTESEINTISNNMKTTHIIAIDDMIDFNGENGYPTVEMLDKQLTDLGYQTALVSNIMHAIKIIK